MKPINILVNTDTVEFVRWLQACNKVLSDHMAASYPNNPMEQLVADFGIRYIKIRKVSGTGSIQSNAAWAFIDRSNGDVLKPASWKVPAKHARGNIFDSQNGMGSISWLGPAYLRGGNPY